MTATVAIHPLTRSAYGRLYAVLYAEQLPLRPGGHRVWRAWCPHCRDWHHHGAGEGHRVAHCPWSSSPYRRDGYWLVLSPEPLVKPRGVRRRRREVERPGPPVRLSIGPAF